MHGSWNIYVFTLVKRHIKLQAICEDCCSCGKSQLFRIFPNRCIIFVSIVHTKWRISQFFRKIIVSIPNFQSILQIKCLKCVISEENPNYSGFLYQMTVYFAFCLVNILIIWNVLYQIQVITPK